MKITNIIQGWANYIRQEAGLLSQEQIDKSKVKLDICNGCDWKVLGKDISADNQTITTIKIKFE